MKNRPQRCLWTIGTLAKNLEPFQELSAFQLQEPGSEFSSRVFFTPPKA